MYDYENEASEDELFGKFKLRVVLKDPTKWEEVNSKPTINLDFKSRPQELIVDGKTHIIFKKSFTHQYLDIDNLKHINIGRYHNDRTSIAYGVNNIKINNIAPINVSKNNDKMIIYLSEGNYNKIKTKRLEAFRNGVLLTEDKDVLKAEVVYKNTAKIATEIRLKGDFIDHLTHPKKWSFRIIAEGGETINGLRKFSVQHPRTRNYLWEWLFTKTVSENDLIGIKYEFLDVDLKITKKDGSIIETLPLGIMALEESFDKILIERNNRREGLLFAIEDGANWKSTERSRELNLPRKVKGNRVFPSSISNFKVYNEGRILSDPKLKKQFDTAINLLDGLRSEKLKVSEAFDIDKLTLYVALSNLFGGGHGIIGSNIKIYYNPVTNKLEPITWDSASGHKLDKIYDYSLFKIEDEVYTQKLIEKLELVSSTEFLDNLINGFYDELRLKHMYLFDEFRGQCNVDLSILEYNSNFIKKKIFSSKPLAVSLLSFDEKKMTVNVENTSYDFPLIISGLIHKNGKSLTKPDQNRTVLPKTNEKITFELDDSFVNAFVSKKNKKGEFRFPKDLSKVSVQFNMLGQKHKRTERIIPFSKSENLSEDINNYKNSFASNISNFDFIRVDEEKKLITFKKGTFTLNKTLVVPAGFMVTVERGFNLDFTNSASIISYSTFECNGTKEFPIKFHSSDSTGAGIFISSAPQTSIFDYCEFTNLSNPTSDIWELSGAVNFNESTVAIKNSIFKNNRCEDGLNIIRSKFTLESSIFKDTKSDAFDGDFVDGTIANCTFINSGNDGVDVSGSKIVLDNIIFENPSDKAISAGENSAIEGSKININGGEIGIVSKDLSTVLLSDVTINDTRLGFSSFQKKSEFGPGKITIKDLKMTNIESDYLIEIGSSLTIDNIVATTVSNKVIDQMYGKEYGKSSK